MGTREDKFGFKIRLMNPVRICGVPKLWLVTQSLIQSMWAAADLIFFSSRSTYILHSHMDSHEWIQNDIFQTAKPINNTHHLNVV